MLATLERGIEGGKWYSLMDKAWQDTTLTAATRAVIRNGGAAGVDPITTEQLKAEVGLTVTTLQRQLRADRYEPRPVKRVWIPKLGSAEKRPLGIPTTRDRIVQTALVYVLEPLCERDFAEHSYGFRPGHNAPQAIARVESLLQQGYTWVVDADLKGYFDHIPQDRLLAQVAEKVADGRILRLIESYLKQGVMETGKGWTPTEQGTPQGAVLSPLLANLHLNPLDHLMERSGQQMTRYADDFVIQCRSLEEAQAALTRVRQWVAEAGLALHPDKTRIVDASQPGGFEFWAGIWSAATNGRGPKASNGSRKCCARKPDAAMATVWRPSSSG